MKSLISKLLKALAYTIAGFVILLAIGVGLLRLMLPRLPEYQDQIKDWASAAIGVGVEFSSMDARWGLNGPELNFIDAELVRPDTGKRIVAAEEVSISMALIRLVTERTVAIDRLVVRDSSIEIRQLESGEFWVQGGAVSDLLPDRAQGGSLDPGEIELLIENVELLFLQPGDERPKVFLIDRATAGRDDTRIAIDASLSPPEDIADAAGLSATYLLAQPGGAGAWDISARLEDVQLAGLTALAPRQAWRLTGGSGDVDVAVRYASTGLESASIDLDVDDVAREDIEPVGMRGMIEYRRDADGWLLAANELQIDTPDGAWPASSFRLDMGLADDGSIAMLDARADYLNLRDIRLFAPLLDDRTGDQLVALNAQGEVRNLDMTLSDIGGEQLRYAVSAELANVGFDGWESLPGFRGLSARVRADLSGGRVELRSEGLSLFLFDWIDEPLVLDSALGTVIWRRSGNRTTVLSDNIALSNADFDSQSNVQITIEGERAPVVDLASRWSLTDLGSAKRLIPRKIMHPKLYQWFQDALVSGRIDNGRTRLLGPIDRFPFDDDEGRFLLQATVEDGIFRYLPDWPAAELVSLDVVLENARLYTDSNISINEGREVRNARVEIADLREGLLTISGKSGGDIGSLLRFASNSPINRILGGQLGRVSASGEASADIDLVIPLKAWREFTIRALIDARDTRVEIDGLEPPITDVDGRVVIERNSVTSENLTARFLGDPIEVALRPAREDEPGYQIVAAVDGTVSMQRLLEGFSLPENEFLDGSTSYSADILFPAANDDRDDPFAIRLKSDLDGVGIRLPPPFGKATGSATPIEGDIRILGDGRISTGGRSVGYAWEVLFVDNDGLDFERGMLAIGAQRVADDPDTRGLHITGELPRFHLDEWMALRTADGPGLVDRIRAADVTIDDIWLLGQQLGRHSVQIDRSARDWQIQVDGEQLQGLISLPYEFSEQTTLSLDMQRLILPGDDRDDIREQPVDPRSLPALTVRAEEFALGARNFGRIEADILRTPEGLVAERLTAVDDSFEVFANGRWVANPDEAAGFTTYVVGGLKSSDIKATMRRLNYQPGLNGDDMSILYDVSFPGGPRADFVGGLDGEVQVQFGPGQLDDIEPGAGRVFGLLSIVALPRRLSLDFRDVFQKGFGFDSIDGQFRIDDGDAYTCNLSLEGPAAAIGIVGRAGLGDRDYEQSAIVSANFGNSLPIVGGLVAGPQAAAALLIFSQIFKKPLQDLSQVYYDIEGPWDEPDIEGSDAASFAATGRMAGCIETSPSQE